MSCEIYPKLSSHDVVVTPNHRLKRYLESTLSADLHERTFAQAKVMAYSDWLLENYLIVGEKRILSKIEQERLFNSITEKHNTNPLINHKSLAQLCIDAYDIMMQWQIPFSELEPYLYNQDVALFSRIACDVNQYLEQYNVITASALECTLDNLPISPTCHYGFYNPTPLQTQLLENIPSLNLAKHETSQVQRYLFESQSDEYQAMLNWLIDTAHNHPDCQIICVVPELANLHPKLKRDIQNTPIANEVNISSGTPLSLQPQIVLALDLIRSCSQTLDSQTLKNMLSNPFCFSTEQEMVIAHEFSNLISPYEPASFNKLNHIAATLAQKHQSSQPTKWLNTLKQFFNPEQRADFTTHARHFAQLLDQLNWPSASAMNSLQHQVHQQFQECLMQLTELNDTVSASEALATLERLCQQRLFQEKTPSTRIQILGMLEASGLRADFCWIMGLNATCIPGKAKLNPMLPHALQRQYQTPHSSAQRELEYSQDMLKQFYNDNRDVIVSSSTMVDGIEQVASPLIATRPISDFQEPPQKNTKPLQLDIISITDNKLPKLEGDHVYGGSYTLTQQANCPFMAQALSRMQIPTADEFTRGLSAINKGNHLHKVLELCYKNIKSSNELTDLCDEKRDELIDNAIEKVVSDDGTIFNKVEKKRLKQITNKWLNLDSKRPSFTIFALELQQSINIKGMDFTVRIDRIDELEDGSKLIIDYKSGNNNTAGWFDERISAPQLPLYSSKLDFNTEAIAYFEVKNANMRINGVSGSSTQIKGIKPIDNWQQVNNQWSDQLDTLCFEFTSGVASVTPNDSSQPCLFCQLKPFCRVDYHD